MENRIIDIFKKTFQLTKVSDSISQKNFSKWDSLTHINLIVEIENEFDIDLDPEEIVKMVDFRSVVQIVEQKLLQNK